MRSKNSRKWSPEDDNYIRENVKKGTAVLAEKFGVSLPAFRKRCNVIGVSLKVEKKPEEKKFVKADNQEKFNPIVHKIKNNSTVGKVPFYIQSERMTVYLDPDKATDKHKKAIVEKYANRFKIPKD